MLLYVGRFHIKQLSVPYPTMLYKSHFGFVLIPDPVARQEFAASKVA
jgi:hypothetical protein